MRLNTYKRSFLLVAVLVGTMAYSGFAQEGQEEEVLEEAPPPQDTEEDFEEPADPDEGHEEPAQDPRENDSDAQRTPEEKELDAQRDHEEEERLIEAQRISEEEKQKTVQEREEAEDEREELEKEDLKDREEEARRVREEKKAKKSRATKANKRANDEERNAPEPAVDTLSEKEELEDEEPEDESPKKLIVPIVVEYKTFSKAEVRKICSKYSGKLIAYYSNVYRVSRCQRRLITNSKTVYNFQRSGEKITMVDGDVIAALPEGNPLDVPISRSAAYTCAKLEKKYVTYSNVNVYFVEKCHKRLFPDWASYIKHREKRGDKKSAIVELSWVEFNQLKKGRPLPSVIDALFADLLRGDAGVDVIPIDEACVGVEGKLVFYYSKVYRIEGCRKREVINPGRYLKRQYMGQKKLKELTSEQWLSLPDGKPIQTKSTAQSE